MATVIDRCLVILISLFSVMGKSCDILESMSCHCHSSFTGESEQLICNNYNNQIDSNVKLTNESLLTGRTFDSFHLTFHDSELNVTAMFFNDLSYLFARHDPSNLQRSKSKASIKLSFPSFVDLKFEDYAFYQLFGDRSDLSTSLTLELTSNGQVTFNPMALHQLKVDQMIVHSSSLEIYSFEEIFNNTQIVELILEGSSPRCNETLTNSFTGKIQTAKFTKMVETISSEEFPSYPVRSMIIEAHEARRINASTFSQYRNLQGIHLIRPRFFFDGRTFSGLEYSTSLETIEIDAETIRDHTFQHVSRIRNLILGSNIRYLSEHALNDLNYLTSFDASKLTLDHLYPSARCFLARYIDKHQRSNAHMKIVPPQAEYCDCIYDFILARLDRKPEKNYVDLCENNQQERCQLSECDVVKNFRLPTSINNDEQIVPSIVDTVVDPPINFYPIEEELTTYQSPNYVHRHPSNVTEENQSVSSAESDVQIAQSSALKVEESFDPNAIPIDNDYDDYTDDKYPSNITDQNHENDHDEELYRISMKQETYKWISISLVCITILCLLLVGTLIWYCTCYRGRHQKKAGFQPVSPSSTIV